MLYSVGRNDTRCALIIIMKSKRYRTCFILYPLYRTRCLAFPWASFTQTRGSPSYKTTRIFLRLSQNVLQSLILVFQLLYPLVFLTHRRRLPIVLSNKTLISIVDLISLPGLIPYLLYLLTDPTQLIALIDDYLPLSLIGCHYLAELLEAQLSQGQLFLESLSFMPLREQILLKLETDGYFILEGGFSVVDHNRSVF